MLDGPGPSSTSISSVTVLDPPPFTGLPTTIGKLDCLLARRATLLPRAGPVPVNAPAPNILGLLGGNDLALPNVLTLPFGFPETMPEDKVILFGASAAVEEDDDDAVANSRADPKDCDERQDCKFVRTGAIRLGYMGMFGHRGGLGL